MTCQNCNLRPAKVHYTEIINKRMVTMDLCVECAEEKGVDVHKAVSGGSYGLGDLVAGLIDSAVDSDAERIGRVRCSTCGYDYSDFKKVGRFGCPECYVAFEKQLQPLLRHIHGSTQHGGKSPAQLGPHAVMRQHLVELKEELSRAIEVEEYEKAARLRDEIREIDSEVSVQEKREEQ